MAYDKEETPAKSSKTSAKEAEDRARTLVEESIQYHRSELSRFRIKAGKLYRGEPFGDEEDGRSKVVLTEVRDAVLQQLPSLMRVFFGPDGTVEFVARRPDAVDLATQQTAYINHIFAEDNPGFFVLYGAFKDALVRRIGIIKWWWEEKTVVESERLTGLKAEDLQALLQKEPDLEIEEGSTETAEDGTLTVVTTRTIKRSQAKVANIPPEEFIYNRSARTPEDAILLGHVTTKTAGELKAMGYKQKDLDEVGADAMLVPAEERDSRRPLGATSIEDSTDTGENKKYSYVEAYVRLDFGKGLEHRKLCFLGAKLKKVNSEPAPDRPFAIFTPDPEPHEIQGLSLTDMSADLQLINSHVARGVLNSLNLSLHPRTVYNSELVNVKDLMNVEIGALVRTSGDANLSVKELTHTFVGAEGLGVLEFFKGIKEERLGTTRASVGLNPDALQSSSQQAVEATVSKAEARTELMARVFAENIKVLFRGLYNLVRRHQDAPRTVRLLGTYQIVDPSMWPRDPDVSVRVGIGGGTKQEKLAYIAATTEKMEAIAQLLGPNNVMSDLKLYRNMLAEGAKLMHFDPAKAWKEITDEQIQQMEQAAQQEQQPTADPAQMLAEAQVQNEAQSLKNEEAKIAAEQELKAAELQQKAENDTAGLQLEAELAQAKIAAEQAKAEAENNLRVMELQLKERELLLKERELEMKAATEQKRLELEHEFRREEMIEKQSTEISKAKIAADAQVSIAEKSNKPRKLSIQRDAFGGISGAKEE